MGYEIDKIGIYSPVQKLTKADFAMQFTKRNPKNIPGKTDIFQRYISDEQI